MRMLLPLILLCILIGCVETDKYPKDFNFIFSYGVMNKNILNTFEGMYSKDLVMNGIASTELILTEDEKRTIYNYMQDIGLFQYPNQVEGMNIQPASGYSFQIEYKGKSKSMNWIGEFNDKERDREFKKLSKMIIEMIELKEGFKNLPPTQGYYQ